jgi:hypothetical protein
MLLDYLSRHSRRKLHHNSRKQFRFKDFYSHKRYCPFIMRIKLINTRYNQQHVRLQNCQTSLVNFQPTTLTYSTDLIGNIWQLTLTLHSVVRAFNVHLQEFLTSRFSMSRDLNFMLSLSVRFNLTKTDWHLNLVLI